MIYASVWRYEKGSDPRDEADVNRFTEGLWEAWTFMSDPGTHSKVMWPEQRVAGSLISVGGIIFFAAILGVIVDVIREKMESLRQGRSKVIERGHTLILGWTDKTILLIEELCLANESEGGGVVVVLSGEKKEQMEIELSVQLPQKNRLGTKVVFRSGSPLLMGDLGKVSAHNARAIIVLAAGGDADRADSDTLRCMLSLRSLTKGLEGHVIAECRDVDNEPLVKLVGGSVVETLVSHDVLGRLMLMSARQPGLAKVYEALLGFDGDEFYMEAWPELIGLKFGEIPSRFPNAIPVGIRSEDGATYMKAGVDRIIESGDEIIVIAEDNDTYKPELPQEVQVGRAPDLRETPSERETILFCGWRRDVRDILHHLDGIVKKGSTVTMMSHCIPIHERNAGLLEEGLDVTKLKNLKIIHEAGNTSVRRKLEALPIESYTSVMIFADQLFESDTMHADSHSLATLLLIRDIQQLRTQQQQEDDAPSMQTGIDEQPDAHKKCPIICEILDPRTQKTIAGNKYVSLSSDFCQTNRLVAQIVAMISEERSVKSLLDELLGADGCSLAVYPASRYCTKEEECSFFTIAERARLFDEIVVGYQEKHSIEKTILNPPGKDNVSVWDNYDFAVMVGAAEKRAVEDEEVDKIVPSGQAFSAQESRSANKDSSTEVRESWTQTQIKDSGAPADLRQVVLAETGLEGSLGEDPLSALLGSCRTMTEPERCRFGQALDMMKQLVSNMDKQKEQKSSNLHTLVTKEQLGSARVTDDPMLQSSWRECCPRHLKEQGI